MHRGQVLLEEILEIGAKVRGHQSDVSDDRASGDRQFVDEFVEDEVELLVPVLVEHPVPVDHPDPDCRPVPVDHPVRVDRPIPVDHPSPSDHPIPVEHPCQFPCIAVLGGYSV